MEAKITHVAKRPWLSETAYTVQVGAAVISVVISEDSGLCTTRQLTRAKSSDHERASRLVKRTRQAEVNTGG